MFWSILSVIPVSPFWNISEYSLVSHTLTALTFEWSIFYFFFFLTLVNKTALALCNLPFVHSTRWLSQSTAMHTHLQTHAHNVFMPVFFKISVRIMVGYFCDRKQMSYVLTKQLCKNCTHSKQNYHPTAPQNRLVLKCHSDFCSSTFHL